ncbi:glycosyltransferase family 4 protein [Streptomyces sclerotialus]|uniref:glycosyltransferase family 4 protein n=1 Tax=Streptomyces sclerotialus TaxID=1957 RepID=UPI0004C91050
MPRTLIVTNDFPPRQGGIETFVHAMAARFPPGEVLVYASDAPGSAAFDARQAFPVARDRSRTLLPTPRVARRAVALARKFDCDSVWFGAAAPLGLLAGRLRRETDVRRIVATTHGHEVWWARAPGARTALRRIADTVDTVTYLGPATRGPIAAALGPRVADRMARLAPGVDASAFHPVSGGHEPPETGIAPRRPVILCAARLVPRKGQDTLIRALPQVRRAIPGAVLRLVGDGPYAEGLRELAAVEGVADAVLIEGGRAHAEMPATYASADVFAMPCRTRRFGLEVEGLGIVFLEAAAAGLPVLAGDSGGAPEAVQDGETGYVVNGRDVDAVAQRLTQLLQDPETAREMGAKGRAWVQRQWSWDHTYTQLSTLLGRK